MTRYKRRRKSNVCPHLVGNTGKICCDNSLHPLKMNRKYRRFLEEAESDRISKISQMMQIAEQYLEHCDLLFSLKRTNGNNCNSALIMELEERKLALKKKLIYLKSKIDIPIPETLNKSLQEIFKQNTIPWQRKKTSTCEKKYNINPKSGNTPEKNRCNTVFENRIQTPRSCVAVKEVNEKAPHFKSRSSWIGSVKSQIFVRTINLQVIAVSIDLFSTGKNLVDVLTEDLGEDLNKYDVIFGTKVIDMNKTLFEQEIYHGTTVDLNVRLFGGGKKQKKKQPPVKHKDLHNSAETESPESWNKQQVKEWIVEVCQKFEIKEDEVSMLKGQNGMALESLPKDDWIRRSPNHGDIFFIQWQKLKEENLKKNYVEENENTDFASVLTVDPDEVVEKKEDFEEKRRNDVLRLEENKTSSKTGIVGTFGEVKSLDEIEYPMLLKNLSDDGSTEIPEFGSVVGVTGICTVTQPYFDDVATLFIRDEPPGASNVFHKMKVVIRSNKTSIKLQPYKVEKLLKEIRTDMHVAVKGRVERLSNEDNDIHEPHCEIIRFKLVVDSDNHSLVYKKRERPQYTRQISQPWWWVQGTSDASSAHCNLEVGYRIGKKLQRVFCESTVSDDEIMNYVVAFKNCYDGEILVGVDKNGVVTGRKFSEGEMEKWREKLSIAITKILPESDQGAAICLNLEQTDDLVREKKCFIYVLNLSQSGKSEADRNYIAWIHVPQGETARVHFRKPSDVHAFRRKGAENKRITNYEELFSSLFSLGSHRKPKEISEEDLNIEAKFKEAIGETGLKKNYKVLDTVRQENQEHELKMVFGSDPTKTIVDKYLKEYTCGFLNASGGTILFGVQEAKKCKYGHIVGIVIPKEERRELLQKAVTAFSKFYPPVSQRQFRLIFHKVTIPTDLIVKAKQFDKDNGDKFVLLRGPSEEIGNKWPKFVKDKLNDCLCRVVPVQPECFCIIVENQEDIQEPEFVNNLNHFIKQNPEITSDAIAASDLKELLKKLCLVELKVNPSQYPIHLIKPIDTHVFDKEGKMIKLSIEKLMRRFDLGLDGHSFDINKFLNHVENFNPSGNSYILISSPFELATTERYLHGLVLPQWTLAIDFDQHPKEEGHLFHQFKELNDILHQQRQRSIKTPLDNKLGLNPEHAICWLAARGYDEVEKTLSKEDHVSWNMTHRNPLSSLLNAELARCVKPNYLNIVVLWDDGYQLLVDSLRTILEDILSITWPRTAVTFVCSTPEAVSDINEYLIQPLQKNYWKVFTPDRVYVAPPVVLSRHLSYKLPSPYQSEDDYQVPHKKKYRGKDQTFPDTLPQGLRKDISSYLKMMYMKKEKGLDKRSLENERKKFYSGGEITDLGLRRKFGIEREKMDELEKEFKNLSKDRKSHVSMLCLKVDRGAGSTTLCLQFLYKHHEELPCAQLLEISDKLDKLLSYIKDINQATKLPLLLFVDEEISHPQDFLDFTKELVECRTVNVILLLIEPAEVYSRKVMKSTRMKSVLDSTNLPTCPCKVVELRRELTEKEMDVLVNHLVYIKNDEKASEKLQKLLNKSKFEKGVRTFAHFGLTAFGQDFLGLKQFVEFRLNIADDKQRKVLMFLSLIHIYTDSHLPASAFSGFLESTKHVNLEKEFQNDYLRELLSPPLDNKDSRRISFHEVAEQILKQLASSKSRGNNVKYWQFIKDVSVDLAKYVLSVNVCTKSIDRLTRRLFVTSEYESEKFSSLILAMKEADRDIARDTLTELVDVFENHSSFRAHIRAHLAKYYMIVAKDFEKAMPLIDEAVKDQHDDSLLRHIHGDIIRMHVQALKKKPASVNMDDIVTYAIKSSDSFEFVRCKRPHDGHGYVSDAIVRITVMQAAIKKQSEKRGTLPGQKQVEAVSFVDYLVEILDEIRQRGDRIITEKERYLLSLIPDAHQFLYDGVSDGYEHKEKWKENFRYCIGPLSNLRRLCDKIHQRKSDFQDIHDDNSVWLQQVLLSIQTLNNGFEIDKKNLTPEQIEERIKEIEECALGLKCSESLMKFWIKYSRCQKDVPHLQVVKKRVKDWLLNSKKQNRTSTSAEFYNYVVHVLIALQDPHDREKRRKVQTLQQGKKYKKDNVVIPQEWLHPKEGHHINSIDSLLHHDDLLKDESGTSGRRKLQAGRGSIEGCLKEKDITKWSGTVSDVQRMWLGTITLKNHFEVRFIPYSVQTGMPQQGETVSFCLGIDRLGLSAWWVRHDDRCEPLQMVRPHINNDEEESSDEDDYLNNESTTSISLFNSNFAEQRDNSWDSHNGKCMQGVVVFTSPARGFGYINHPDVPDESLFFHALQLVEPVITLEGTIEKLMVLEFRVEKLPNRTRASNIHVVKEEDVLPNIAKFRHTLSEQNSSPSTSRRQKENSVTLHSRTDTQARETGVVVRHSKDETYGFIESDNKSLGKDIFFHLRCLPEQGPLPSIGQRVQFTLVKTEKGLEANGVFAVPEPEKQPLGKDRYFSSQIPVDQNWIPSIDRPVQLTEKKTKKELETNEGRAASEVQSVAKPTEQDNLSPKSTQEIKREKLQSVPRHGEQENSASRRTQESKADVQQIPSVPKPAEQEHSLPKHTPEIKQEPLQTPWPKPTEKENSLIKQERLQIALLKPAEQVNSSPKPSPEIEQEPLQIPSLKKPVEREGTSPKVTPEIKQELLPIPSLKPGGQENPAPSHTPELKQESSQIPSIQKPAEKENYAPKPTPEIKQEALQIPWPKPTEQENSLPKPTSEIKQERLQIPSQKRVEQENSDQKPKLKVKQKLLLKQLVPRSAKQEISFPIPAQEINQEELKMLPVSTQVEEENSAPRPTEEIKPDIEQSTRESIDDTGKPSFQDEQKSKKEPMSTGHGLDDVFMSHSNFDSLLPVDDFHDMCNIENLSHTRHPVLDRFFELPSARALRNDSRKTSPRKAGSNPPDFLPSFMQTSPKKPQVKKRKPQKKPTVKSCVPDGQISLRPVRDSFGSQDGVKSDISNQKRKPNLKITGTKERSKPVNKASSTHNFFTEKPVASDEKAKRTQKDFAAVRVKSEKLSNVQTTGTNEKPKWTEQAFTSHGFNSEKPAMSHQTTIQAASSISKTAQKTSFAPRIDTEKQVITQTTSVYEGPNPIQKSSVTAKVNETSRQTTGTNARLKSTPKALTTPKVDPEKQMVKIIEGFLKSKNVTATMKNIRDLKSTQSMAEAVVVEILKTTLQESEEKQKLAGDLLTRCSEDKIFTKSDITKGVESCIRNLSKSEMESDVVAAGLGKISARLIAENVLDLRIISEVMKEVDLLFLECLKELKGQKGENWLLRLFENSQVDLMTTLPEQFKKEEKMVEILLQQGLIFLSPQLKVKADLFKQIQKDPNALSLCQWIKYNFDVKLRSSPEFASILTTCVLKYVTMETSLGPGVDRKQHPSQEIQNKEKLMLEKFKPLVKQFVDDDVSLQVIALYALQEFCYYNEFPKGLLLRMFIMLYDLDIIEEDAFISWKEDINEQHPGKGKALFQVNAWLTWLETATEESSESEPELN